MKLATIRTEDGTKAAVLDGGKLVPLDFTDVGAWLRAGAPEWSGLAAGSPVSADEADFAPVITEPRKIIYSRPAVTSRAAAPPLLRGFCVSG
ncbi:hypothetical protein ACKLTP_18660, partial [Paenarthrobacter ureafaciens]